MKRMLMVFCVAATFAVSGAGVAMTADTLPKPEALSEETIHLTEQLSKNYDTLVIRQFKADNAEYSRVDDEERKKLRR